MAHRTRHGRRPRRLLTEGTPAVGVTRPIIDSCDNLPHVSETGCLLLAAGRIIMRCCVTHLPVAPRRAGAFQRELVHPKVVWTILAQERRPKMRLIAFVLAALVVSGPA